MRRYITLLLCISLHSLGFFSTLEQLKDYTKSHKEHVDISDDNWVNPDFGSYYKTLNPGYFAQFLSFIGLKKAEWSNTQFLDLLDSVTENREKKYLTGTFAQTLKPKDGTQFVIFGDLHAALHSLVRDLTFLHEQEIISNDLIIKDSYIFIFNGNAIDLSPYSLETLSVIMQLMHKNPEKVIYIKGDHETEGKWQNYSLNHEIRSRFTTIDYPIVIDKIERFFNTLPEAVYLTKKASEGTIEAVRISYFNADRLNINPQESADQLAQASSHIKTIKKESASSSFSSAQLKSAFFSPERKLFYTTTPGLLRNDPQYDVSTWSVLSSPITAHNELFSFYNDAFVILSVNNGISTWTLSLYARDIRTDDPFEQQFKYNIEGQRVDIAQKEIKKQLTVGCLADTTKGLRSQGRPIQQGLFLRLKNIEEEGILLRVDVADDQYNPQLTQILAREFLKYGINTFLAPAGSPTLESYLDLIRKNEVLVLFPVTGTTIAHDPTLSHIINFRPSFSDEAEILTLYALTKLKASKGAIFYQDDAFGKSLLSGSRNILQKAGITNWLEIPYSRTAVNFERQAKEITDYNPDVILFFALASASKKLIEQIGIGNLIGTKLLGNSDYGEDIFQNYIQEKGLPFIVVNVIPNPKSSTLGIVKQFRTDARKERVVFDIYAFEAYLYADLLVYAMKNIDAPITNAKLISFFESIKDLEYKGLKLNFDKQTRTLSQQFWMDVGNPDWELIEKKTLLEDFEKLKK